MKKALFRVRARVRGQIQKILKNKIKVKIHNFKIS